MSYQIFHTEDWKEHMLLICNVHTLFPLFKGKSVPHFELTKIVVNFVYV